MTEADSAERYEQRARAIQLASQSILDGFEHWLKRRVEGANHPRPCGQHPVLYQISGLVYPLPTQSR